VQQPTGDGKDSLSKPAVLAGLSGQRRALARKDLPTGGLADREIRGLERPLLTAATARPIPRRTGSRRCPERWEGRYQRRTRAPISVEASVTPAIARPYQVT
jgi:hypothetical protein